MKYIGTTETYDPFMIPDWDKYLLDANIIISKRLSWWMIDKLVANKDKIIFHHTITGFGGTKIEPGVPSTDNQIRWFTKLIEAGFPISHYVLRVDPIIPFSDKYFQKARYVFSMFNTYMNENYPIEKYDNIKLTCRISFIDLYKHVIDRFNEANIKLPWTSFHAPIEVRRSILKQESERWDRLQFVTCGEPGLEEFTHYPCANKFDLELLGENLEDYGLPEDPQRSICNCLAKKQILRAKPGRCPHKCLYCYWKDY